MRRINCVLLPAAGRRTQLFHLIFTESRGHLEVHPCNWEQFEVRVTSGKNEWDREACMAIGRKPWAAFSFAGAWRLRVATKRVWRQISNISVHLRLENLRHVLILDNILVYCLRSMSHQNAVLRKEGTYMYRESLKKPSQVGFVKIWWLSFPLCLRLVGWAQKM